MKNMIAVSLLLLAVGSHAEGPAKSWELLLGPMIPMTKVEYAGRTDDLAGPGVAFGGRFLAQANKNVGIGAELMFLASGEHESKTLVSNAATRSKFASAVIMGEVRVALDSGPVRPFLLGGVGFHSTRASANSTPVPGFVWADTGTRETRTTVSATKTAPAATLQGGLQFPLQEQLMLGVSAAYYYLGKATYDGVSGSIASVAFLGSLAYRF